MRSRLKESFLLKIAALALLAAAVVAAVGGAAGYMYCESQGWYGGREIRDYFETDQFQQAVSQHATQAVWEYLDGSLADAQYSPYITNFSFQLYSASDPGALLAQGGEVPRQAVSGSLEFTDGYFAAGGAVFRVDWWVNEQLPAMDQFYYQALLFRVVYTLRYHMLLLVVAGCAAAGLALAYLFASAGHRRGGEGKVTPGLGERLPLEVYLVLMLGGASILGGGCTELLVPIHNMLQLTLLGIAWLGAFWLLVGCLLGLVTRVKLGKFWHDTLIWQALRAARGACRAQARWARQMFSGLPYVWQALLVGLCAVMAEMLLSMWVAQNAIWGSGGIAAPLYLAFQAALLAVLCRLCYSLYLLRAAAARMAAGQLESRVDVKKLWGPLRSYGEYLNQISEGMGRAVEQRMKSERFKTELITNVSHDLKTPLTSIINYVDLLQKQPLGPEAAQYAQVIARQGQRLKKLTEDLVEASKASTGNLTVELAPTDLAELLNQAAGEYAKRLEDSGLEVVLQLPAQPVWAMLDGRRMWRVLDNLLSNACKYSQPGTRVYLEAAGQAGEAIVNIKNISKQALNIPPEELMERFVRGDSSRTTEGSGLGLNIARSLVELQKGSFVLTIDGDLFKAQARFEACPPPAPATACPEPGGPGMQRPEQPE